jgi:hypothetical protein
MPALYSGASVTKFLKVLSSPYLSFDLQWIVLMGYCIVEHFQDSSLEWCRSFVRPKIVLFPAHTIEEGHEILHLHDFFRVTLKTGEVFAVDLSAWQFGFRSWFYTWSEYVEECIGIENVFGMTVLSAKTEMMRVLGKSVGGRTEHDQHLIDLQLRFYEMDGEKLKQWRESVEPVEF